MRRLPPFRFAVRRLVATALAHARGDVEPAVAVGATRGGGQDRGSDHAGRLRRRPVVRRATPTNRSGPGFADTGLGIDACAGAQRRRRTRRDRRPHHRSFVAGQVAAFADPTDADHAFSGGAVGKLALLAEVTGADPRSFGGFDLIAALGGQRVHPEPGRPRDRTACPAAGLYRGVTSTFGQSLGLIAQARSGGAPAAAVAALRRRPCPDGSFRSILPARRPVLAGGGDVDSTSMAAQALSAAGGHSRRGRRGAQLDRRPARNATAVSPVPRVTTPTRPRWPSRP